MLQQLRTAVFVLIVLTILTGGVYPLVVTAVGQLSLSHSCRIPKKHLQRAAFALGFLGLNLGKKLIGVGSGVCHKPHQFVSR
jgi:hypothetical protein